MKTKRFEGATQAEAEKLAADWIKSHPGCRVLDSKAIHASTIPEGTPIGTGGTWTLVLEYDDPANPA
ncbi:MAG: hypothetical protein AB7H71_07275 [Alphaproteobacteria bacterium]